MRDLNTICLGRQRITRTLMFTVWILLSARLMHIQYFSRDLYALSADRQQIRIENIEARPGDILDRHGRLLATTLNVPSLFVDPTQIEDPAALANALSDTLNLDSETLLKRFVGHADKQFLWIRRHLRQTEFEAIRHVVDKHSALDVRHEFQRFYPQGQLASNVLGLRNIDGIGQGGIEQYFDEVIRGENGKRRFVRDARGKTLEILEEVTQPPRDGMNVVLTLDAVIQLYAENALDELCEEHHPVTASAIVMDPKSGEILAMASRPTLNPNDPQVTNELAWKNHAIATLYEPGSTFKPFVAAWGLQHGFIGVDESIDCEWGAYQMGGRVLHDHHPYGELSLRDILVKSSNIGMAKIGERIGNEELFRMSKTLGFGHRTGLELPGEIGGIVRPIELWNQYSTGSIPMGHEIAVTPIQMISAHAILANRGHRISPHLLLRLHDDDSNPNQVVVENLLDPQICQWILDEPMSGVVEQGTGRRAHISGLSIFGKTGTAQKFNPAGGYYQDKNVCSFICGASANDPQALVLVCVDEPRGDSQFGGVVAAPVASRILQETLAQLNSAD